MRTLATRYDAIVIGLGGMGSASAYHLARRGRRVLGLERFDLLHDLGSSHGLTRIIRLAYHEHPSYVPLLRRAYELWRDLEADAGERLLVITGSLEGGPEDGSTFRGALEAAELHDLENEVLDAGEMRRRYPAYAGFDDRTRVVYQPDGGFLDGPTTQLPQFKLLDARSPLADLDGDGVLDLVLYLTDFNLPAHGTVRLGDGAGGFTSHEAVSFASHVLQCLPVDVNADGRIDLVSQELAASPSDAAFTQLNLTYAADGPLLDLGHSKASQKGWPILLASGAPGAGDALSLRLFLGWPEASTVLIAGTSQLAMPWHGGTLVPSPDVVLGPMLSDAQGGAMVPSHWPPGVPSGATVIAQFWQLVPGTVTQYAASTAVQITAP